MITVDIHTHTIHGHGADSVFDMFVAGQKRGLKIHGFSEHSPRPCGYNYTNEYRTHLEQSFLNYIHDVQALATSQSICKILLGLELDWLEAEPDFMHACTTEYPYDYVIAGIHFLGTWGFDDQIQDWQALSFAEKNVFYTQYYETIIPMANSKLFHVLAHPDLIKIFSIEDFHTWLPHNLPLVEAALLACKDAGMVMEISSAGLRKPCKEIYPCPSIMELAQKIQIPISFASDGHCVHTIAKDFDILAQYAAKYAYTHSAYFENKTIYYRSFSHE